MLAYLIIGFFVLFAVILTTIMAGMRYMEKARKKQVATMLQAVSEDGSDNLPKTLLKAKPEEKNGFELALQRFDLARKIRMQITQADLNWSLQSFFTYSLVCGVVGAFGGSRLSAAGLWGACVIGMLGMMLPYFVLRKKRRKRLDLLEAQLPEALDFLARSMRAGHALTISLTMAGEELPEPISREFRTLAHEQNLGSPMSTALDSLCKRVPLLDLRFFSTALLLQRQTGGNLSEILRQLSNLIRERFRLKGQVKALSAHGRLTSMILTGLPMVTTLLLTLIAPDYLGGMAKDPDGFKLIIGAGVMMLLGTLIIQKIIRIEV
jgi:tight adherence protein B